MPKPDIKVLGIYRLRVTKELFGQQFDNLYGYEMSFFRRLLAKRDCKQQLKSVALIEVLVTNRDERFSLFDFTQRQDGVPRDSWQAACSEAFLSTDGETLIPTKWPDPPDLDSFRCAFFLHFFQSKKMLLTTYGARKCPPIEPMPERLERLVPFEPVD